MDWIEDTTGSRKCWFPKSHLARLNKEKTLGRALSEAHKAFKGGKRQRLEAAKLKKLKEARAKAQAAYDAQRKDMLAKSFYIIQTGRGYVVRTLKDGGHAHAVHAELKDAQAERPL